MFAYIPFGSSKSALPGELENDLAYTSNLSSCDLLSIYMYPRSIKKRRTKETKRDEERRIERKVSVEADSLREKVEFGSREPVRFCIGWRVLNYFCASVLELCSTEVESFVLIEQSCSVDFALQLGKAWKRIFLSVVNFVINSFLLETVVSVCCGEESSSNQSELGSNQLYKSSRLIADYFLSPNKIKFRHSFVSAWVFGLPSSTGSLGFPNKDVTAMLFVT